MKRTLQLSLVGGFLGLALFVGVPQADAAVVTVKSGDTLSKLFPSNWPAICRHNGLANCNLIYVGQLLDDGAGGAQTRVAGVSTTRQVQSAPASVPGLSNVLGKPYVWGGTGPWGFDCSGMTQYLAAQRGISIPRTTYQQMNALRWIPLSQARPRDIIMFNSGHNGTYLGNNRVVHATVASPAGAVVYNDHLQTAIQYNGFLTALAVGW